MYEFISYILVSLLNNRLSCSFSHMDFFLGYSPNRYKKVSVFNTDYTVEISQIWEEEDVDKPISLFCTTAFCF